MKALNTLQLAWLKSEGVTATNLNDAWRQFLLLRGLDFKSINDTKFKWLRGLGYKGAITDMINEYYKDNVI